MPRFPKHIAATLLLFCACLTPLDAPEPPDLPAVLVAPDPAGDTVREEREKLVAELDEEIQSLAGDAAQAETVRVLRLYRAAVSAAMEDSSGARRRADVIAETNRINYKCRRARYLWTDKLIDWGARERRLKRIFGVVTGGVGTVGGAVAGISAGVDQQDVATWSGGITAVLGVAGTLATTFVSPDKDQVESAKGRIAEIDNVQSEIKRFLEDNPGPSGWGDDVQAQWASMIGRADADCEAPSS